MPSEAEGHVRRRVLFLLPFPPRLDAIQGGARAMAQHLANLAEQHTLALLVLRAADEPEVDPLLRERCDLVVEIERPEPAEIAGLWDELKRFGALLRGIPVWVRKWHVPAYAGKVTQLARDWHPDIVQIEYQIMAQYLPALAACAAPRVLTVYEPRAEVAREARDAGQAPGRRLPTLDLYAWQRFERVIMGKVQGVVVFTERDREAMARFGWRTPIMTIPITTPLPDVPLNTSGKIPPGLLFVGNFTHLPNVDAAQRLAGSIFPAIHSQRPDVRLWIVGDRPPAELMALAGEAVTVTGRVPDVRPYLEAAAIVVVPMRLGGGMRVKVMEALAAGKAVIASRLAVEGLDVTPGEHYLPAETDEEFEIAILTLLIKPQQRFMIGTAAYGWARANLGWDRAGAAYERLYDLLLQQRKRAWFGRAVTSKTLDQPRSEWL